MDKIKAIYGVWSSRERQAFKAWLGLFRQGANGARHLALLKEMDKNPELTLAEASTKLYGDAKSKAFLMLKRRLYERMTDFMCGGLFQSDREVDPEMPYMGKLMEFRKAMSLATVLTEKRLSHLAVEFLEKGLELAKSCAAPELELDCLIRLRGLHHFHGKSFAGLSQQIELTLERSRLDARTLAVYHAFFEGMAWETGDDAAKVAFLETELPDLQAGLAQCRSLRAQFYLHLLETNRARFAGNLEKSWVAANDALNLLMESPGLKSRQRMADVHVQLGQILISSIDYNQAIIHFICARPYLKVNSHGFHLVSLLLVYALLLDGRITDAEEELASLNTLTLENKLKSINSIFGLFDYLKSCLAFFNEDIRLAFQFLIRIDELRLDKPGWQSGLRLYEILLLVDLGELEVAESRLEALRKHLDKYGRRGRVAVLYELLHLQGRRFFDFQAVPGEAELLARLEREFPWDPLSHELVRIDFWYRERAEEARG